jgi:hypothetical protein
MRNIFKQSFPRTQKATENLQQEATFASAVNTGITSNSASRDDVEESIHAHSQDSSEGHLCTSQNDNGSTQTHFISVKEQSVTVIRIGETPVDVFLQSFRNNGSDFISSAYLIDRSIDKSVVDGSLSTSLAEDIFTLVDSEVSLLNEYLESSQIARTDTGDVVVVDALLIIFRTLRTKQSLYRDSFLRDVDSCVAAANDFLRMSDKAEQLMMEMEFQYPHISWNKAISKVKPTKLDITRGLVEQEASDLVDLFMQDAVLAAQRSAIYIMQTIQESTSIPSQLFSHAWEEDLTYNEVAKLMVRTYAQCLANLEELFSTEYL